MAFVGLRQCAYCAYWMFHHWGLKGNLEGLKPPKPPLAPPLILTFLLPFNFPSPPTYFLHQLLFIIFSSSLLYPSFSVYPPFLHLPYSLLLLFPTTFFSILVINLSKKTIFRSTISSLCHFDEKNVVSKLLREK